MVENSNVVINQNEYEAIDENGNNVSRNEFRNNSSLEKISNILYVLFAGIITILPVGSMIIDLIDSMSPDIFITNATRLFVEYSLKVLGIFIYFYMVNKTDNLKKVMATLTVVALIFVGLAQYNCDYGYYDFFNGSYDQEAGPDTILAVCKGVYIVFAFALLIMYLKDVLKFDLYKKNKEN